MRLLRTCAPITPASELSMRLCIRQSPLEECRDACFEMDQYSFRQASPAAHVRARGRHGPLSFFC